jgi:hypothetical protein
MLYGDEEKFRKSLEAKKTSLDCSDFVSRTRMPFILEEDIHKSYTVQFEGPPIYDVYDLDCDKEEQTLGCATKLYFLNL